MNLPDLRRRFERASERLNLLKIKNRGGLSIEDRVDLDVETAAGELEVRQLGEAYQAAISSAAHERLKKGEAFVQAEVQ
jgi:hypothetical protein